MEGKKKFQPEVISYSHWIGIKSVRISPDKQLIPPK